MPVKPFVPCLAPGGALRRGAIVIDCDEMKNVKKAALEKSSFHSDDNPPCASPAPNGGGGALRCLCITCTGNFYTIANR